MHSTAADGAPAIAPAIKVMPVAVWHGPNPLSPEPVVVAELSIDPAFAERATVAIGAIEALHGHWLVRGKPSAADGDEALASFLLDWALAALNHGRGFVAARGLKRLGPGMFRLWLGFHDESTSLAALRLGAALCGEAAWGQLDATAAGERVAALWRDCSLRHPNAQAEIIAAAARAQDVPVTPAWGMRSHWQYGWGARGAVTYLSASNADGYVAGRVAGDKRQSKALMRALGLPYPGDVALFDEVGLADAVARIGLPCVVKPADGIGGGGVSAGVGSLDDARAAFSRARAATRGAIMVERFAIGDDYRLVVHRGKLVGAFRRDPPRVVGDGARSVRALVQALNRGRALPARPRPHRLAAVAIDERVEACLAAQGLTADAVPPAGQVVTLRDIANVEAGGSSTEVTARVHPDVAAAAEALACTLGANLAGLDYITTDIARSWHEVPGVFIEVNLTPGLYVLTLAGRSLQEVGALALPEGVGRIPVDCLIVADAALAGVEARLGELRATPGEGWASPGQARAGTVVADVAMQGPWPGITTLLANRTAERALLVLPASAIMRHGFPLDRVDRVMIDDARLPGEWLEVLQSVSAAPLSEGGLDALLDGGQG